MQPNSVGDIDRHIQGDVSLAKKPLPDLKDSASVVSEKPNELEISETTARITETDQTQAHDLSEQGEGVVDDAQPHLADGELVVQVKSEPPTDFAIDTNAVYSSPETLNHRSAETTEKLAEKQENLPEQDIFPPVDVAKKLAPSQEFSLRKPDVVTSALPVTKIMKEGDTLAGLMKEVYGSASPSTLRFVLDHNRHIVNVRKIYPGQQILFPPLNNKDTPKRPVDSARVLVSQELEKLGSSKKIFTQSSTKTKPNQKKNRPKRAQPYAVAIVKEGDTLEKLAKVVYGSSDPLYIQRVLDYNPHLRNPKKIFPGQDIAFPKLGETEKTLGH